MNKSGKEESEEIKNFGEEPKKMNLRRIRKIIQWPIGKGKDLLQKIIIKLFAMLEIILLLMA